MTDKLGRGFAFPMVPDGDFPLVDGADAVMQALYTLLSTEPGERVGRPEYGCGLRRFLFQTNTVASRTLIRRQVEGAIARYEPRVRLESVNVTPHPLELTRVDIDIRFFAVGASTPQNLVYPFYLEPAGGARR